MGKSLKGKELGTGITQRADGRYQGRFTNRFGKREYVYGTTITEVRKNLQAAQYDNEKALNVVDKSMTLDEWFDYWMQTYKRGCRNNTKITYSNHYKRIQKELGWRKLSSLNQAIIQSAFKNIDSDNARANSKKILSEMLDRALESDLVVKNCAKSITVITSGGKKKKKDKTFLSKQDVEHFLMAVGESCIYYNLFVVAIETGMRIGELTGLQWKNIDFDNRVIHVKHSLCYFPNKDGKYIFELHETKTDSGERDIPMTQRCYESLRDQYNRKKDIINRKVSPMKGYEDIVFFTRSHRPSTEFLVNDTIKYKVSQWNKTANYQLFTFSPHSLRHTFASNCLEAGLEPKIVQALLGHSSIQMTMDVYCHVSDKLLIDAMNKYDNFINKKISV